jgi:hypothetical protein
MPDSYVGLPQENWYGAGKLFRAQERTIGGNVVEETFYALSGEPTYWAFAPAQACAGNKYFFAFLNNAGSGKVRTVRKLFIQNAQLAVIASGTSPATVGMIEIDILRITAITGGTAITPNPADTTDPAMTNYTCVYSPTSCTDSTLLCAWYTNNDEIGVTGDIWQAMIQQLISADPEEGWGKFAETRLNPGEGLAVKMITNFTLGQFSVFAVISEAV